MPTPKSKAPTKSLVRLNKFIADCGVCSRRKADELIDDGLVKVNGRITYELGLKIDPKVDQVTARGKKLMPAHGKDKVYLIFNKPAQVLTSMSDPQGRPLVADFFKKVKKRIFPVGRLDWETEGLLLMTNDGDFANEISHPKSKITKTYLAKLDGKPTFEQLQKLKRGVTIIGGRVKAKHVLTVKKGEGGKYSWVKIVITEGKNRQVRRMFEKIGFDVKKLQRTHIGRLSLAGLKKGDYAHLTPSQLMKIFRAD